MDMDLSDPRTIAGIIGAALGVVLLIVLLVYCCCRGKCRRKDPSERSSAKEHKGNTSDLHGYSCKEAQNKLDKCYRKDTSERSSAKKHKGKNLDLHGYSSKEAQNKFVKFLSTQKKEYNESGKSVARRFINVITGRGKHSKNGVPVIKNNVGKFLKSNGYKHRSASHGGMVTIDLNI